MSFTAPAQNHFGPTRIKNVSLPASLTTMKLAEFSGDPLNCLEWSGLFLLIVNIDTSLKMKILKTMVIGKAKDVIAGLGYTYEMYDTSWNTLGDHKW